MTRRDFLGGFLLGAACLALPLPSAAAKRPGRTLVLLHLNGGNDGLNTVIPGQDPLYRKLRPGLAIPAAQLVGLDKGMSFHPSLKELARLYEQGKVAVIQGVGYPDPSLSHFRSAEVWQCGSLLGGSEGWLGRYLDQSQTCEAGMGVGTAPPLALASRQGAAATFDSPERFEVPLALRGLAARYQQAADQAGPLGEVGRLGQRALEAGARLRRIRPGLQPEGAGLARDLRLALALIEADLGLQVLHLSLSGFDTHDGQAAQHSRLLGELSRTLAGFQAELSRRGLEERVLTVVYSEFGRRPQENSGGGTDHGTAGPMLLLGGRVRAGLLGQAPPLADLVAGNLRYTVDFRSVYAGLFKDWFGTDPAPLVGAFQPFSCTVGGPDRRSEGGSCRCVS